METKFELIEEPESQEEPVDNQGGEAQEISSDESGITTPPTTEEVTTPTEEGGVERDSSGVVPTKGLYTAEEMRSLDPTQIDTSRIPPEQQAFYKSMQSGWTKKFQEVADLRKQVKQITEAQVPRPRDVYEAFDKDPHGVLDTLRTEIVKKKTENPYDENIVKLENLKDVLIERRLFNQERATQAKDRVIDARETVKREVPEFEKKVGKLNEFASNLGFSMRELAILTDPVRMGPMATKLTLAINKLYDIANKDEVLKNKATRPLPTKVETAGTGEHTSKPAYKEVLRKARETGDWTEYLEMKGAL